MRSQIDGREEQVPAKMLDPKGMVQSNGTMLVVGDKEKQIEIQIHTQL